MDLRDRILYHQVHSLKLMTDIGSAGASLYLAWSRLLAAGLLAAAVPPVIASSLVIRYGNLEGLARSRSGQYLRRWMTQSMQFLRLGGFIIMFVGAWYHAWWALAIGMALIPAAWLRGMVAAWNQRTRRHG